MEAVFFELGAIIIVATLLALIFKAFKQPAIPAYILTGLIMGPFVLNIIKSNNSIEAFSQIGIAFLLFIVGLNLNIQLLREVGKVSVYTGLGQIFFTTIIGYFLLVLLDFTMVESLYLAVGLAFSSTIIIVKLLSDNKDLEKLYGKISIGFLLVQDAVAIFILIFLSSFKTQEIAASFGFALVNGLILIGIAYLATKFFLTKFFERVARSQETLFLSAISWCFAFAIIAYALGFGIEIGAFLAGICLASLPYSTEISNKVKPLRDFFIILFFFIIGASLSISNLASQLPLIILLSLFVLIGNPLIVMAIMGIMGFKSRTGFLAGLTVAQISEFSLILIAMGSQLGHVSNEIVSIMSAVGIITIAISSYLILHNDRLFRLLMPYLKIFERKNLYENKLAHHQKTKQYDIILIGHHRVGYSILKSLSKKKKRILVVDYNPTMIQKLMKRKIPCLYADISDPNILEELTKYKPKTIISTIHLFDDNILVTKMFRKISKKITIISTAVSIEKALDLYDEGADYVIIPQILSGEKVSEMLSNTLSDKKKLKELKNKHIHSLFGKDIV